MKRAIVLIYIIIGVILSLTAQTTAQDVVGSWFTEMDVATEDAETSVHDDASKLLIVLTLNDDGSAIYNVEGLMYMDDESKDSPWIEFTITLDGKWEIKDGAVCLEAYEGSQIESELNFADGTDATTQAKAQAIYAEGREEAEEAYRNDGEMTMREIIDNISGNLRKSGDSLVVTDNRDMIFSRAE